MLMYNAANWYWYGKPQGEAAAVIYSSAKGALVSASDAAYADFLAAGGTATPWPKDDSGAVTTAALDVVLIAAALPATGLTPPTNAGLKSYAATKRFAVETGGITVSGTQIDTSRDSQAMVNGAYAYVTASGAASVTYKATSGWVTMDAATIKAVALAVGAHVQAAFAAEHILDGEIDAGTITTTAQIDAYSWAF